MGMVPVSATIPEIHGGVGGAFDALAVMGMGTARTA
jgi:hypothetical protein